MELSNGFRVLFTDEKYGMRAFDFTVTDGTRTETYYNLPTITTDMLPDLAPFSTFAGIEITDVTSDVIFNLILTTEQGQIYELSENIGHGEGAFTVETVFTPSGNLNLDPRMNH